MTEKIVDLYTEEAAQKILKAWYPYTTITVNDKVALKLYEIIEKSKTCSTVVGLMGSFVGGPTGTVRKLSLTMINNIRSVLKKVSEDKHSLACLKTLSAAYKNELMYLGM